MDRLQGHGHQVRLIACASGTHGDQNDRQHHDCSKQTIVKKLPGISESMSVSSPSELLWHLERMGLAVGRIVLGEL
jgi:hypothetical protein